jgi:hypothetical protein
LPAEALAAGATLRVAASTPNGRELPALLALHLAGFVPVPVFGLPDTASAGAALRARAVDAIYLQRSDAFRQVPALGDSATPLFTSGIANDAGHILRDPAFPSVPSVPELILRLRGVLTNDDPLFIGWRATAAAGSMDFAVVAPQLAPPARMATWRQVARAAIGQMKPTLPGIRLSSQGADGGRVPGTMLEAATLLALRHWVAARLTSQPS